MFGLNVVTLFLKQALALRGLMKLSGVSLRGLAKGLWATLQRSGGRELQARMSYEGLKH